MKNIRSLIVWSMYARLFAVTCLISAAAGLMGHDDHGILRIMVFLVGLFSAFVAWRARAFAWAALMLAAGATFNPIMRMHTTRTIWISVDIAAAAIFAASCFLLQAPKHE